MTLTIPKGIYDDMIAHCVEGLPNEACGFISGSKDWALEKLYRLTNEAASPVFYRPSGKEMIEALADMDRNGYDLVAIFHSHVASEPYPSPTDRREAHYPDTVYIIVSLADRKSPSVKGYLIHKDDWRDEDGKIEEVPLVVS